MKTAIIAATLLALTAPAQVLAATIPAPGEHVDPYKLGMRDYRRGLCFRARPYGPPDQTLEEALWIAGYDDAAMARAKKYKYRDSSRHYVEWPPHCRAKYEAP